MKNSQVCIEKNKNVKVKVSSGNYSHHVMCTVFDKQVRILLISLGATKSSTFAMLKDGLRLQMVHKKSSNKVGTGTPQRSSSYPTCAVILNLSIYVQTTQSRSESVQCNSPSIVIYYNDLSVMKHPLGLTHPRHESANKTLHLN